VTLPSRTAGRFVQGHPRRPSRATPGGRGGGTVPGGSRERHGGRTDPSRKRDPVTRTPERGRPFVRPTRGGRPLVRLPDLRTTAVPRPDQRTTTVLGPDERTTAPVVSGPGGVTSPAPSSRTLDVSPREASRPGRLMGVTACQDPHEAPRTHLGRPQGPEPPPRTAASPPNPRPSLPVEPTQRPDICPAFV